MHWDIIALFLQIVSGTFMYTLSIVDIQWNDSAVLQHCCSPDNPEMLDLPLKPVNLLLSVIRSFSEQDEKEYEVYYYHGDHLGSASWITNQNATAVQYVHYAPYGEQIANQRATSYDERFKFTGKERDSESGYDYFGARFLWSPIGIWLSVDPLADKYPGLTPYLYCNGNPVMLVDPDGRDIDEENEHTITQLEKRIDRKIAWTRFCQRLAISSERQDHLTEKMDQLQTSKDDFSKMREDHSTIYTFVAIKGGEGFTTNETSVGEHKKIAVNYCSKENLIHESRHAGDIARANILGLEYKPTLMGEVSAYKAQLAFSGSIKLLTAVVLPNLPMLTQAFEINSFKSITKDWVRQIVIFHKKEKKYEFPYKDLQ